MRFDNAVSDWITSQEGKSSCKFGALQEIKVFRAERLLGRLLFYFLCTKRPGCNESISHLTQFKLNANKLSNLGSFNQPFDNLDLLFVDGLGGLGALGSIIFVWQLCAHADAGEFARFVSLFSQLHGLFKYPQPLVQ